VNSYDLAANTWWPPAQPAADDYVEYAREYDRQACLDHYDAVAGAAVALHIGNQAGGPIASFLRDRIERRVPTSLIRLGDADGNVLFSGLDVYPELTRYNLQKISRIYFGSNDVMVDHAEFFFDIVVDGIHDADLVGGPERGTIDRSFDTPYPDLDVRGMCGMRGVYNYLATATDLRRLAETIWASTWFSRALLPHYFDLVRGLPFLGFVTCYPELEEVFRDRAGVATTTTVAVPMQASIAKVHRDIRHYPDAYPGIVDQLRPPHEGAVYIVAAGILSKAYCTTIKARGGIAIDVGSVADVWMGARTRPDMPADFVDKWRIAR
jgi:hypothetical protein